MRVIYTKNMERPTPSDSAQNKKRTPDRKTSGQNKKRILVSSLAAVSLAGLTAPSVSAATAYTIVPAGGSLDWNTDANWTSTPAANYPGTATGDSALVTGDFGGAAKTVNISGAIAFPLVALTLGDTNATPGTTTVSASPTFSLPLSGATITSAGTAGAVNTISAPIALTGNLTFAAATTPAVTNDLTVSGKITGNAAATRTFTNASGKAITLGEIDLSASTNSILTITNTVAGSRVNLSGVIANGGSTNSGLTLNGGVANTIFELGATNTYTGATVLQGTSAIATTYLINGTTVFGTGTLTTNGGGNAVATFEAVSSDRTIANNWVSQRGGIFTGTNSLTFSGNISSGNSVTFTNNITAPGKVVKLGNWTGNNNIADLGKQQTVAGLGTTVFTGNILDSSGVIPVASVGILRNNGAGTVVITGTSQIQGGHLISNGGTFQLGDGVTTGAMAPTNAAIKPIVTSTSGGFFAVNSPSVSTVNTITNGQLGIKQLGGTVTLTATQFNTGTNTVGDGSVATTLIVTEALTSAVATTVDIANAVGTPTARTKTLTLTGSDTFTSLGLKIGQPVYLTSGPASAATYIQQYIDETHVALWGPGTLIATGTGSNVTFGAGSALGTGATTVNNLGTLAGTGVISGSVTTLAGSRLAPGVNTTGNFGVAGTLTAGGLTLTSTNIDFDLASTAAGVSDLLSTNNSALTLGTLAFSFNGLTPGVVETGAFYSLINYGSGTLTGDTSGLTTASYGNLGAYTANYSIVGSAVGVTFTAVPEPGSVGAIIAVVCAGGAIIRRRMKKA
jgi:hypothetical protein